MIPRHPCILPPALPCRRGGAQVAFVIVVVFLALQLVGYAAAFI